MKRTILRTSLWGILTLTLFYSCRTDSATTEQTIASKEKIAAFERFEKENNIIKPIASNNQNTSSAKYVSYSYPFAQIIYNFLQNHPDYAKKVENEAGTIRLDVVSQTFGYAEKSVIFPVTNNEGKVVGIWAGVINEERDYVNFYSLNQNTQGASTIITAFQNYYDQKERRLTKNAIASIKGLNPIAKGQEPPKDPPVKAIEEVVITVPAPVRDIVIPSGPTSVNYGNTLGGGMSGGSTTHGGGGNGTPSNQSVADINYDKLKDFPCAYALAQQLTNEKIGGDLARLLKETFGANERVNISFETSDNKFLGETVTGGFRFTGDANNFNGTVYLNKDRLSNATQDFLLSTMYHEVLHGYLNYERSRIGETEFNNRYPAMESYDVKFGDGATMRKFLFIGTDQNHNRMGPFIDGIKQAVLNFDPSYPAGRAEALAMGGIIAESALPPAYRGISSHEADGSTAALGKRCSK
ncbi:hypothetical protein CMT52_08920 [Elizabethkingia anophelis]|nr:hypothetical protein [Elizabethkingia anophelis]MDV4024455.1 hypothetical protein [Elizabethkingia anophelis]